jgi:hypothetical protein
MFFSDQTATKKAAAHKFTGGGFAMAFVFLATLL